MAGMLEVAVDSLTSARAAIAGGADRLELCCALAVGGLTPYAELLQQIRTESDIPVRCLIRPRGGDFLYTSEEIMMMAAQIGHLRESGADGFVIGCLNAEGYLDAYAMEPLLKAAEGTGLTLHRCIDVSRDPCKTYLDAHALGFDTVLTSGAASSCLLGMETIGRLLRQREEHQGPEVLIGSGVNASAIAAFRAAYPQARAFHMSG
ncbi:MAG: copper homeostasis protein CutC, partial [Clostridia bacterium]|nr:copper homeostasis protein CutC [Clostridia bacterium]